MFSEKELKLARLALDSNAPEGEWQTAAIKFFQVLRGFNDADPLDKFHANGNTETMMVIPPTQPDYGLTFMPWGMYKNQMFKDIPPGWLMAKRDWIRSAPDTLARWGVLAEAIDKFLDQ